jgi:hypothetical protein
MPMNRGQFQKGLSMPDFFELYGTKRQCEQAVVAARWPRGFVCPACGVFSGTVFEAIKLPLTRWFLAMMQLLTQAKSNVSALELTRQLGVSYRTAWLMKQKRLQRMRLAEADRKLTGRVEVNDAYLGGERSGAKRERGSENKVPFIVAVQTIEDGRPPPGLPGCSPLHLRHGQDLHRHEHGIAADRGVRLAGMLHRGSFHGSGPRP